LFHRCGAIRTAVVARPGHSIFVSTCPCLDLPASLKRALQDLAAADRRKLGPYIRLALEAHVGKEKSDDRKILP
jgi:hypothetical protein